MAKESGNSSGEVMIRRQRVGRRTGSLESGSGSGGLGQCFNKIPLSLCSRSSFVLTQRPKATLPGSHGLYLLCGPLHSLTFQEPRPQSREPTGVSGHEKELLLLRQLLGIHHGGSLPPRSEPPPKEGAPWAQPSVPKNSASAPMIFPPHQETAPCLYFSSTAALPFTRRLPP